MNVFQSTILMVITVSLMACGSGGDDGPVTGIDRNVADTTTSGLTEYYLKVSVPIQATASPLADSNSTTASEFKAYALESGEPVNNLTRDDFESVVLVPDINSENGIREVKTEIAHFEFYGDGVYRVDIDGVPQVNGVIYVNVGDVRYVFLTLKSGTRAVPVEVSWFTDTITTFLIEHVIVIDCIAGASVTTVEAIYNSVIQHLQIFRENAEVIKEKLEQDSKINTIIQRETCNPVPDGVYTVTGKVTGNTGKVRLNLNQNETIAVMQDKSFRFQTRFSQQDSFSVEVVETSAVEHCAVYNATGDFTEGSAAVYVECNTQHSAISTGAHHSCAITNIGQVQCWGDFPSTTDGYIDLELSRIPEIVEGISNAISIASGTGHACALIEGGTIQCWGYSHLGQLGDGGESNGAPAMVEGMSDAIAVAVGGQHSCAVRMNGEVSCWGDNQAGQLGNSGADYRSFLPIPVAGINSAIAIVAGGQHTCALLASGMVQCWGDGQLGQLGTGNTRSAPEPVTVLGIEGATAISAGANHSCAALVDGSAHCWGNNSTLQLGRNDQDGVNDESAKSLQSSLPVAVPEVTEAIAIAAGSEHTCALEASGEILCWGSHDRGQLGKGWPIELTGMGWVEGIGDAITITSGGFHSCALRADKSMYCWGANEYCQLGTDCEKDSATPVPVQFTKP